ncbi:MAG: hypothetical protein ABIT07_05765 [Ferruginibacter sp.]
MNEDKNPTGNEADITPVERSVIEDAFSIGDSREEDQLKRSELDTTDEDGTPLNEGSSGNDLSGADLDIPGTEADDEEEKTGEEDEENNGYSQADSE